jgi:hypothetical protein
MNCGTEDDGSSLSIVAAQTDVTGNSRGLGDNRLGHSPRMANGQMAEATLSVCFLDVRFVGKGEPAREGNLPRQHVTVAAQAVLIGNQHGACGLVVRSNGKLSEFQRRIRFSLDATGQPWPEVTVNALHAPASMGGILPAPVERLDDVAIAAEGGIIAQCHAARPQAQYHNEEDNQT